MLPYKIYFIKNIKDILNLFNWNIRFMVNSNFIIVIIDGVETKWVLNLK